MKTEVLIHQLTLQVRPVKPIGRPITRFGLWLLIAAPFLFLGVNLVGVRPDLGAAFYNPVFPIRLVLTLGITLLSVFSALALAVPNNRNRLLESAPAILTGAYLLFLGYLLIEVNDVPFGIGVRCLRNILIFGVPTGALLYLMLKKAAPLKSETVGLLAALGSASFANFGTQFICRSDSPLHLLVWHLLPVLTLCCIGVFIGRLIFKKERLSSFLRTDIMDLE